MDGLLGWEFEAECEIHDGFEVTATLSDTGDRIERLLGNVPGGIAGSVGMIVSF